MTGLHEQCGSSADGHPGGVTRNILGVDVQVLGRKDALSLVGDLVKTGEHRKFAFLNAHGANIASSAPAFRDALAKFMVLSDGIGLDLASRVLYGKPFPENLNGTDFIPALFDNLDQPAHVALLGARPGIADAAAQTLAETFPKHRFTVVRDGYFDRDETASVLDILVQDRPDVLLVAFGNPAQELWIAEHLDQQHATAVFGVGALFDFVAGRVPRAPDWMISVRFEWLFRLFLEPNRMWRRYLLGNPAFLIRVIRQRFGGRRTKHE